MINAVISLFFSVLILIAGIKHFIHILRKDGIPNELHWSPLHVVFVFGSIYIGSYMKGADIHLLSDAGFNTFCIVFGIESIVYLFKNRPLGLFLEEKDGVKLAIMLLFGLSVGLLFSTTEKSNPVFLVYDVKM